MWQFFLVKSKHQNEVYVDNIIQVSNLFGWEDEGDTLMRKEEVVYDVSKKRDEMLSEVEQVEENQRD